MSKLIKILTCCLALGFVACSEADIAEFYSPVADGGSGTLNNDGITVSALDFKWEPIAGVYQYGYKLTDPDNRTIRQGITKDTSIRFERLEQDTQYTLEVEAYGSNGVATKRFVLVAKTDPIVQLAKPDLTAMTMEVESGVVTLTWPAVTNAALYQYALYNADGLKLTEDQTEKPTVSFNNLPAGDYTISIIADNEDEAFTPSEASTYAFTREREFLFNWAVTANTVEDAEWGSSYDGAILIDKPVTVEGYDDYFIIRSWLGTEGEDVKITFDPESEDVTSFTPISNGIEGTATKSGYAPVSSKGTPYYSAQMYIGSGYSYASASEAEGYVLLSGYFYVTSSESCWMYYEISWGDDSDTDGPLYTVKALTATNADWAASYDGVYTTGVEVTIDVYADHVMLHGWAGGEGNDLEIGFDADDNVTYATSYEGDVAIETVTKGYLSLFTGHDKYVYVDLYLADGYCYASADADGGYVLLSGYFYPGDKPTQDYLYYYIEWGE